MSGNFIKISDKFGYIGDLGSTEKQISADSQAVYPYLTSAVTVTLSSSDVDDDAGDTGAQSVHLFGLDGNYDEINEIVVMNGQSAVSTVKQYLRVFRLHIETAGSSETNEGDIYVGTGTVITGVPAVVLMKMMAGDGQSTHGGFTMPNGMEGHIKEIIVTVARSTGTTQAIVVLRLMEREDGGVFRVRIKIPLVAHPFAIDLPTGSIIFPSRSDYEPRAVSSNSNTLVGISTVFELREDTGAVQ